jgi:L-seryl-tRNA(Ser) seleniumtransferase
LAEALSRLPGLVAEARPGKSQPGSGSAPDVFLDTVCVVVERRGQGAEALARALRAGEPPVFGRIQEGRLWLDPRTLLPGEETELIAAFEGLQRSP